MKQGVCCDEEIVNMFKVLVCVRLQLWDVFVILFIEMFWWGLVAMQFVD